MEIESNIGQHSVGMLAGGVQNVVVNERRFTSCSTEEYPAKLLNRIATAIPCERHPSECYADVLRIATRVL
jgi:hypothetical protein